MFDYETVLFEVTDHVASVTLNRPEAMNAFNRTMMNEFRQIWGRVRVDDDIHVVVLRAAGDRAFSTGLDVKEGLDLPDNPWSAQDPGEDLSPKQNKVWKPVIAAVQGTVRAIWETHGLDRETAQGIGWHYTRIGNPIGKAQVSRPGFVKPDWTLR